MIGESNFSILIVDDDTSDLDALNEILKQNYVVYFAKSGQAALKRAAQNKPDLILLDVVMPDMSGFEVLSELGKSDITKVIPVIFITGLNSVENEEKGFHLGAVDYITKPFHSSIVKARIESQFKTFKQLRHKDAASVTIKTRQEVRNILFRELIYVDVSGHWLNFHLYNGTTVEVYATLKEYEDILLVDPRFGRCHKSFILNMDYIEVVEIRDVLLKNGVRLPISKGFLEFKKKYLEWVRA